MRIAYLINQYPSVSHSFIRREILALERLGLEVTRIALRGWDTELADADDKAERARTIYVLQDGKFSLLLALVQMAVAHPIRFLRALTLACRMSRGSERPLPLHLAYLAEAARIEPLLRAGGVQHLHAHFGTNSAEVAMLVHVLGGPRWSFTVHGIETFDRRLSIGLTEKIRQCAFVAAVCSYGRSQLYRSVEPQQWDKVKVVHCGLEPSFYAVTSGPASAPRSLVCVGRLCEEKGQLLLVEAASRLAADGMDFELVLAGDGELRSDIEALIILHGLQGKVRITGWISSDQVRDELLGARALVLPSFAEGLPVAIMEAMALRRPVISTFVAGIPELVRPGVDGWLLPAGDVEALVETMRDCLNAPADVLARMGETARERVLARHDVDKEAGKLAALFATDWKRSSA